jgi:Fe-S oxidoreductase
LIFLEAQHEAVLVVEYSGNDSREILWLAKKLANHIAVAESLEQQKQIWNVRKAGLGIIQSRPGDLKPLSFIEDLSVPVEELGKFIREIEKIMSSHGTTSEIYAHASAGCLHIRPFVNVKTSAGIRTMREIAEEAVELTIHLGGSISGEHGDGFARSEWLERMYGRQLIKAFKELKEAADPREILNPGKKVGLCQETEPPRMDENLRYGSGYQVTSWQPVLSFDQQGGLPGAIEQCNGAGVCRKSDGVMCPSFQASGEEMHSTRGRANLLRAMISAAFQSLDLSEKYVYEALDLCLACKGCKSECPSSVDMAKLKYEFLHHYYQSHPRKSRDSLFGFIEYFLRLGQPVPWLVNPLLRSGLVKKAADQYLGISQFRSFPALAKRPLRKLLGKSYYLGKKQVINPGSRSVFFLSDAFTEYMYPETGVAAVRVLEKAGFKVYILPFSGAGRTYLSKGFLEAARSRAMEIYAYVTRADPANRVPVVGVEPSEIYALRDEYPDLLDPTGVDYSLAGRSWMIDEFLLRQISGNKLGELRIDNLAAGKDPSAFPKVLLHGHCYQKTQPPMQDGLPVGVNATIALLNQFGCEVRLIESSCCGMAGAFGYESEHYHFSMQVGELKLFPAIRSAGEEWVISTSGVSCHSQIQDGTSRTSLHPIQLIYHLVQSS